MKNYQEFYIIKLYLHSAKFCSLLFERSNKKIASTISGAFDIIQKISQVAHP